LTTWNLKPEYRLLHNIVANHVLPTDKNKFDVTDLEAYIMFHIILSKPLNLPLMIVRNMSDMNEKMNWSLPYGIVITKIVKHFNINTGGFYIMTLKPHDIYNVQSLKILGWRKENGFWTCEGLMPKKKKEEDGNKLVIREKECEASKGDEVSTNI
ncbi:hypothetical protein CFOL_v3_24680, partial [Cephalotus follicularis]